MMEKIQKFLPIILVVALIAILAFMFFKDKMMGMFGMFQKANMRAMRKMEKMTGGIVRENYTSPGGCANYDNTPGNCTAGMNGIQIALKCELGRSEPNRDIWCPACDLLEPPTEWTMQGETTPRKVLCYWRAVNDTGYYINLILENPDCKPRWNEVQNHGCKNF